MTAPDLIRELRTIRLQRKWTHSECAARIGVPTRTLKSWEYNQRSPTAIVLKTIFEFVKRWRVPQVPNACKPVSTKRKTRKR